MTVHKKVSRRRLLGQAAGAAVAGMILPGCPSSRDESPPVSSSGEGEQAPAANEQIGVGIIGCGRRNAQLQVGRGGQGKPPAEARIVAVADVFDALTSERPYKRAWPLAEAFDHLETIAGSHLDPDLVEAFLCIRSEITQVAGTLREGIDNP